MQLNQEMQSQGQWLFRWRSYLPLLFLVLFIPALQGFHYPFGSHFADLAWESLCLLTGLLGLTIRCLVIGYAPKRTSGRNTKGQVAETLNTKGMYSLVRNPLYLGNFFMWAAPVLFLHAWWLVVIYVLVFILCYERIIITEETFLFQKFGGEYARWAANTPAIFPRHLRWENPDLPFSWRNVIRREYHGLFGLIAALTAVEIIGDLFVERAFILDPFWVVIFLSGMIFYFSVRYLAKRTNVLQVEGR